MDPRARLSFNRVPLLWCSSSLGADTMLEFESERYVVYTRSPFARNSIFGAQVAATLLLMLSPRTPAPSLVLSVPQSVLNVTATKTLILSCLVSLTFVPIVSPPRTSTSFR